MQQTRLRILKFLQVNGEANVETLAEELGLAPVTVRHHLGVLREREYLDVGSQSIGRGRPRHVYRLSPQGGEALCEGNQYATLASSLLETVKASNEDAGPQFFVDMAERVVAPHESRLEDQPIEERLDTAVELLWQSGYSSRWESDENGFVIHQMGCPYVQLSETHDEVCYLDMEIIRRATGKDVDREASRRDGSSFCTYRVSANGKGPS